jgi:hypothetical protein
MHSVRDLLNRREMHGVGTAAVEAIPRADVASADSERLWFG